MVQVRVKKLHDEAVFPTKAHQTDAGFDLHAANNVLIKPGETKLILTGIAIELTVGYELQVRPRSGISLRSSLKVILGTIDSGYRGEIGIIAHNTSDSKSFQIYKGDKIAQAVIQKLPEIELIEVDALDEGERGENGFGSTGV